MNPEIDSRAAFDAALKQLPPALQRRAAGRFIAHALDLSDEAGLASIADTLERPEVDQDALTAAHRLALSVAVRTHPQSDLSPLDFRRQAGHFLAEACVSATAPAEAEHAARHIAQRAAAYCRMARTCAAIPHDQEAPSLEQAQSDLGAETQAQYRLLEDLLTED